MTNETAKIYKSKLAITIDLVCRGHHPFQINIGSTLQEINVKNCYERRNYISQSADNEISYVIFSVVLFFNHFFVFFSIKLLAKNKQTSSYNCTSSYSEP